MSKQAQLRQTRKIRRQIGSPRRTRLMVAHFLPEIVACYYRDGSVRCAEYSRDPKLRFAIAEIVKNNLYEQGFTSLQGGDHLFRRSITLKDLYRLFPKTQIKVLPNSQ